MQNSGRVATLKGADSYCSSGKTNSDVGFLAAGMTVVVRHPEWRFTRDYWIKFFAKTFKKSTVLTNSDFPRNKSEAEGYKLALQFLQIRERQTHPGTAHGKSSGLSDHTPNTTWPWRGFAGPTAVFLVLRVWLWTISSLWRLMHSLLQRPRHTVKRRRQIGHRVHVTWMYSWGHPVSSLNLLDYQVGILACQLVSVAQTLGTGIFGCV